MPKHSPAIRPTRSINRRLQSFGPCETCASRWITPRLPPEPRPGRAAFTRIELNPGYVKHSFKLLPHHAFLGAKAWFYYLALGSCFRCRFLAVDGGTGRKCKCSSSSLLRCPPAAFVLSLARWQTALRDIERDRMRRQVLSRGDPLSRFGQEHWPTWSHNSPACADAGCLYAVDRAIPNAFPYVPDQLAGKPWDDWESPLTFLQRSGDCEDYAIAKYLTLRLLGIPKSEMAILIVREPVVPALSMDPCRGGPETADGAR